MFLKTKQYYYHMTQLYHAFISSIHTHTHKPSQHAIDLVSSITVGKKSDDRNLREKRFSRSQFKGTIHPVESQSGERNLKQIATFGYIYSSSRKSLF